jgi:hypothetical protein
LWAVDASGVLRSVVREGDAVAGKQVKTIQALKAVNGIAGRDASVQLSTADGVEGHVY